MTDKAKEIAEEVIETIRNCELNEEEQVAYLTCILHDMAKSGDFMRLTADDRERADRRYDRLLEKGLKNDRAKRPVRPDQRPEESHVRRR